MRLENLTDIAATVLPSMSGDDHQRALVVAMATFTLPTHADAEPELAGHQPPPPLSDDYNGDPECSSLRVEGQAAYTRPGTDIYLRGHAWAPQGRRTTTSQLHVRVGPCSQQAMVFGDRVWVRNMGDLLPSPPAAFEKIPILWERSFGGTPQTLSRRSVPVSERNPVGRGLFDDAAEADEQPLPNFEDPTAPITSGDDRPAPVGFGPIARHWQPRRSHAGTYDQRWIETRAPLWPKDMDERLFCAAAPGLCATPHLRGAEPVELVGLHPDGAIQFPLPSLAFQARFDFEDHVERHELALDAVDIDTDAWTISLIWRACSGPADGELTSPGAITLRELADWERA